MNQCSVRRDVHLEPFGMAGIEQLTELRMKERFTLHVQVDVIRVRLDLIQYMIERIQLDEISLSCRLRTEGAGQVAYACNFYIYFFESFHDLVPTLSARSNDLELILYYSM